MAGSHRICAALLAAGQSLRFGEQDKLAQDLHGRKLGLHVAETLQNMDFADKIAIVSSDSCLCIPAWTNLGFDIVMNPEARAGMATSVALAARHAQQMEADGLLICLADMPFVSGALLDQLVAAFRNESTGAILCATEGDKRSPPALFGSRHFAKLASLSGDAGARDLIAEARVIAAAPHELTDIDTPAELEQWNGRPLP
ncbi:molybdenum cofactor cytidylyltransferase [Parasphingorhabdus marina DSM 22363]|uniref:Molybdenum cofactor cytidylyltransferase n=1 Tax=Parasphingorhabdus marina DSM 22363 TaxID=1123272 RepID=A0A1N6CXK9_9SPHN|nr:nucleotidyltransferase family protein [Parasphingorhabdus marina]SIN63328.1 molybdenum cofactor cytidylyltransferase [Parasphingorhabdus marina DSM 22363]